MNLLRRAVNGVVLEVCLALESIAGEGRQFGFMKQTVDVHTEDLSAPTVSVGFVVSIVSVIGPADARWTYVSNAAL